MSLTPANQPSTPWWLESQTVLVARLQSGAGGLSEAQAAETLKRVGPNELRSRRRSLLARLGARLRNPLVLLLIAASAVSAVTGDVASFLVILVVVLMSIMLDFVQETRAANAAERLRRSVALRSRVLRGGTRSEVAATGLVPGDIVLLAAGDLVPADGLLLEARDCFVNQALLTGEPYPVEKNAEEPAVAAGDFATAANAMFMGTSLISGSARVLIVRTGAATVLGDIADTLAQRPPPNALETGSHRFGLLIMRLTVFLVLFVLLANALLHRPWLESFLFAVALAVGLTPELLPMIISVTLARGALREE